MIVIIIIIKQ